MVIAVYPGTFDPLTRGHEDLVRRAAGLFPKLVVGVADSRTKGPFFSFDERLTIAREVHGAGWIVDELLSPGKDLGTR